MRRALQITTLLCLTALCFGVAPALAEVAGPGLETSAEVWPTHLPPGGEGMIFISVLDIGAADTHGTITVTDQLPPGVTAIDAGAQIEESREPGHEPELWDCTGSTVVTCRNDSVNMPSLTGGGGAPAYNREAVDPKIAIAVKVAPSASGTELNRVTVTGGGAPAPAATVEPLTLEAAPAPFGASDLDVWFGNSDGTVDTQAGSHPYSATFIVDFNLKGAVRHEGGRYNESTIHVVEQVRNIEVELPPGLVGDPQAVPQCPRELFENDQYQSCPADTQIGVVTTNFGVDSGPTEPVFNVAPPPGKPAEFGFTIVGNPTYLDSRVRTGTDDGITTDIFNVPQRNIQNSIVTLWSNPGDHTHAPWSGSYYGCRTAECLEELHESKPFLTLPTACAGPQKFTVRMHPWFNEAATSELSVLSHDSNDVPTGYTGCEHLGFQPTITTAPDTARTDSPAGLTVEVKPPVGGLTSNEGLSTADIQNTTVTLPEGVVINPGQAAGLQACQPGQDAIGSEAAAACPGASKVGVVSIATPLLPDKIEGAVYVLQSNPPELKLLVAGSADGVNLKLVGVVHLNEATGQLTTKFEGTPELPFTDFKLSFSGGPQAALDTPTQCGLYTTTADFTPWSSPFIQDFQTSASFSLSEGPEGSACPSAPLPFAPAMTAGATTDQAGGFTGFSMLLQRGDGQQRIERLQFKAPAGLSGMIAKVPLCTNAQAEANACPEASKIGHTVVASGPGPYPLVVPQPGQEQAPIYLTESYEGAPFGLAIVVPLHVGPFVLQTQRVRARIDVDPHTSQITITTDSLPQIVDGIPTDLRTINAVVDRPGFMFNPTSCRAQSFTGTAYSAGGAASAPLGSHFQVGSCRSLTFKPNLKFSTTGASSRAGGASLTAKIVYPTTTPPANQASTQSNIASVKVDLPKQLPSRLTTLQKACTAAQFDSNPAGCPLASVVGHAKVITPILPVPLTGPAYFVSHGGEAFPQLIVVLQGYGVTVDLVGDTFISKAGITSSTFKSTPDVPFSSFELNLPRGKYSALASNLPASAHGSFCGQTLSMPTALVGQNGAVIHQSTKVAVTGCPKTKKAHKRVATKHKATKH